MYIFIIIIISIISITSLVMACLAFSKNNEGGEYYKKLNLTPDLLINLEKKYGGATGLFDIKDKNGKSHGNNCGGDRMIDKGGVGCEGHGYAQDYSNTLSKYMNYKNLIIAEVGILRGSGLAIWSELFPNAEIFGFDLVLKTFYDNLKNLRSKGAFKNNNYKVYTMDQMKDNKNYLKNILNNKKVNVVIDDGCHSDECILSTLDSFLPHLAADFTYIIEDNSNVHKKIDDAARKNKFNIYYNNNQLTILTPKT